MSTLHTDEVDIDDSTLRQLVDDQFPQWRGLSLRPAGHGTDNRMVRLGDELVLRLPRTPGTAEDVAKESWWLPRLSPYLPLEVPTPMGTGAPGAGYPFPWSVYRWIEGEPVDPDRIRYPELFGVDLARFVRALHRIDLMGASREGTLSHYRGGRLSDLDASVRTDLEACRWLPGLDLDLTRLEAIWEDAVDQSLPAQPHTWMHSDLKPSNLVVRDGRLVGVIDFGGLSVGDPAGEHAAIWDLPAAARRSYAEELVIPRGTRVLARAWALAISLSGVPYYWETWPAFVQECLRRLRLILADPDDL